ncbi:thrombospondin type 3 repeat-containing protein [Marinicellulosiphila megalodicopiae]|uniref:thrombospondin type 3 repeat-containing protein n=1 Tax=Marinicellulosiphila megalodicopiae TaxID=2724896 RepID=UPI003BAFC358
MHPLLYLLSLLILVACQQSESINQTTDTSIITIQDLDNDGIADAIDPDIDGDNIANVADFYPTNVERWNDVDMSDPNYSKHCDCITLFIDSDNDGYLDEDDLFPNNPNEWSDLDGDGIGDNSDLDIDGDLIPNDKDLYPYNKLEAFDFDNDSIPNGQDDDDDNDLHLDIYDRFPANPNEYLDSDNDGVGNNSDRDVDGDGLENGSHLENAQIAIDMGLDGDDDNDTYLNHLDQMPFDPNEHIDTDQDGVGNNEDLDDDNDGYLDFEDLFPANVAEWADHDNDTLGDNEDLDDDNDGVNDITDSDPFDPDVPSIRSNDCATPDIKLSNINTVVDFINAMPKPLSLSCFVQALPRPLKINATESPVSAQPALNSRSPRVFINFSYRLYLSIVMDLDSQNPQPILELSELTSDQRSIKGELYFPIEQNIDYGTAFNHIRNETQTGTLCGLCHSNETLYDTREQIEVYESLALKAFPTLNVQIHDMRNERNLCDDSLEPYRCDMYRALFDHGTIVKHEFPSAMSILN